MIPQDFDRALWLSPLEFQGLLGWAAANGIYYELFREDEFAKPIAQLHAIPKASRYLERCGHPAPPSPTPAKRKAWLVTASRKTPSPIAD